VVIVGAGLAGLAAATHLHAAGIEALVVEASDGVGGRVRTDLIDGFRLDRGFQLYNPSYPEGQRLFDYAALDLKPFVAGAEVVLMKTRSRIADPRRKPSWAWASLLAPLGSARGELNFARYAWRQARAPMASIRSAPDITTEEALIGAGIDSELIERFLRPFLGGVFLDDSLTTSRRFFDLVLRSFVRGTPSVPALGMGELSAQLHRQVADHVLFNTTVTEITATGVRTQRGAINSDTVLVATDPRTASVLTPGLTVPDGRPVTTWYHHIPSGHPPLSHGDGVLVLDGSRGGPLINTVVLTQAAPSYAPPGHTLVSSSALGKYSSADMDEQVRQHLARLYDVNTSEWELIAHYPIPYALPAMTVPLNTEQTVRLGHGRYVAGDHRDTASIQGALVSGRRAAEAIISDRLGKR
jgi:phytoene dehydrogenase-like protein